jgi:hypothetical protein
VDQARTMLRDLRSVPGLPPHVPGFLHDMGRFCEDLGRFRQEFIAAARKPGDSVMIASLEYGQLTLISGNDTSLLFNNVYRVPIQLQPSQLTYSEITNLAQLLVSAGNQIPSLPRYREFLTRRNEIMSSPPPSRGGANDSPDGRGQRRPPTLPPPPQRGAGGPGQQRPGAPR